MAGIMKKNRSYGVSRGNREAASGTSVSSRQISVEAYYNYLRRMKNNSPGNEMSDWLEAEKALQSS